MGSKSSKSYNVEQVGQNVKTRESLKKKDIDEKHLPFVAGNDTVIEEIISAVQKSEEAPRLSREEVKKEEDLIIAMVRGEITASENLKCDVTPKESAKTINDLDAINVIKEEISESVPIVTVQNILEAEKSRAKEIVQKVENHVTMKELQEKEKEEADLISNQINHFEFRKIEEITNITCINKVNTNDDEIKSTEKIEECNDDAALTDDNNTEKEENKTIEETAAQKTIVETIKNLEPVCNHQIQSEEEENNLQKAEELVVDENKEKIDKTDELAETVIDVNEETNSDKITEPVVNVNEEKPKKLEEIKSHQTTEPVDDVNEEKLEEKTPKDELPLPQAVEIIDIVSQTEKQHNEVSEKHDDVEIIKNTNNISLLKDEPKEISNEIKVEEKEEAICNTTISDESPGLVGTTNNKEEKAEEKQLTPKEAYLKQIFDTEKIINGMKEKILHFNGSAEDKQFSILHEELIKHIIYLDDIAFDEEEVKTERRRVIKMIQLCVQNLEKKIEQSDDEHHLSDTE